MKTYYLFKRIVNYLDSTIVTIQFCRMRNFKGLAVPDHILIDHTCDLLAVFVHEVLHLVYPSWTERKVRKTARWFIVYSTWYQKKILLNEMLSEED